MTTPDICIPTQRTGPRVWLVAGLADSNAEPVDHPDVRDDQMRQWHHTGDGQWHTPDGRHHATWAELHARHDLVEVTRR